MGRGDRGQRAQWVVLHLQGDRTLQPLLPAHAPRILRREVKRPRVRAHRRLHLRPQRIPRLLELVRRVRGGSEEAREAVAASRRLAMS